MEMNTQIKSFLLFLTSCLAFLICQLPSYLTAFSQPWKEILPAPPANTVMIAGASQSHPSFPNFVRTKEGQYYKRIGLPENNDWIMVKNVDQASRHNLLESEYNLSNPLIPFLFNRPRGTVIDHFYTEHFRIGGQYPPPRYRVYYVLLDGGTLWSWSDPLLINERKAFHRVGVIYAVIVTLLVMKRVGRLLSLKKDRYIFILIFYCLTIGFLVAISIYSLTINLYISLISQLK